MKPYFKNYPLAKTALVSILLLFFLILMGFYFPKNSPEGFKSFIIAFEFADSLDAIQSLFSPLSIQQITKVNIGNYIDFGFMFCYTLFLILAFKKTSVQQNNKFLKVGIPLALVAVLGDIFENIFLLKLSNNYLNQVPNNEIISNLHFLAIFTWLKWISLALAFFIFYAVFMKERWSLRILGVVFLIPLLYLLAAPERTPEMLTIFTNSIFLCFFALTIYMLLFRKKA